MNLIEILKYANSGDILIAQYLENVIFKELTYNYEENIKEID